MRARLIGGLLVVALTMVVQPVMAGVPGYPRAGWQAELDGMFHNVSGTITIVDAVTLQVDHFSYDGQGISVYFYLGASDSSTDFSSGLGVGPQLLGTVYDDDSLTITLPPGETLDDYGAISVWCVAVGVSFGSGSFRPDRADADNDGDVDLDDHALFEQCMNGPGLQPSSGGLTGSQCRIAFDANDDFDVDLEDYARFQSVFTGPPPQSAEYRLTFTSTWSESTHPQDFPSNPHFSGLIGGTHNDNVFFWEEGGLASAGIESMAETGSKTALIQELNAAIVAGDAGVVVSGGGISLSPGSVSLTFTATQEFPLITMTSMVAPSPDWFVAVDSLPLFAHGLWADEVIVALEPYDAGTDSGPTFASPNADTNPADPISVIVGYPFLNGATQDPLGTFTFTRIN